MTRRLSFPLLFLATFVLAFPIYAFAQATAGAPTTDILSAAKSYYLVYGPGLAVLVYAVALLASHIAPTTSKVYQAAQWILTGPVRQMVEKELGVPSSSGPTVPPAVMALLIGGALLLAAPARAQEVPSAPACPATLCAIGQQGNWGFGLLPTVTTVGVDVHHGTIVGGLNVGTSLAATWMPGQLKSVTIGLHAGVQGANAGAPTTFNLGATISFLRGYGTIIADWQAVGGTHAFVLAPALGVAF